MSWVKSSLRQAFLAPGIRMVLRPFRRGTGTIFMLGRLTDPETGAVGQDPEVLRETLAFLRRRKYQLVGLREMFRRLREADPSDDLGVAFTLDDGYAEQLKVAGPIFAEFDCPATVFLTTGFLDGELWQWWDRIEFIFDTTSRTVVNVAVGRQRASYHIDERASRTRAHHDFTALCKRVPDAEKNAAIARLAVEADVELTPCPPTRYAPMDWEDVRRWESRGMTFGPHSVSHPILSRATASQSRREIADSWNRVAAMVCEPVPVFCYPNGEARDQGAREWVTLHELKFEGAITAATGYAAIDEIRARPVDRFLVRHFAFPDQPPLTAQCVSGGDRILHGTGEAT